MERLYIDVEERQVFIKFTDQVSALRVWNPPPLNSKPSSSYSKLTCAAALQAVNALQGRIFSGNTIVPKFYDSEKFEKGVYR